MYMLIICLLSFGAAYFARFFDLEAITPVSSKKQPTLIFAGDTHSDIIGSMVGTVVFSGGLYTFYPHLNYAGKFLGLFMILSFILFLLDSNHRKVIINDGKVMIKSLFSAPKSFQLSDISSIEHYRFGMKIILQQGRQLKILCLTENYHMLARLLEKQQEQKN